MNKNANKWVLGALVLVLFISLTLLVRELLKAAAGLQAAAGAQTAEEQTVSLPPPAPFAPEQEQEPEPTRLKTAPQSGPMRVKTAPEPLSSAPDRQLENTEREETAASARRKELLKQDMEDMRPFMTQEEIQAIQQTPFYLTHYVFYKKRAARRLEQSLHTGRINQMQYDRLTRQLQTALERVAARHQLRLSANESQTPDGLAAG